MFPFDLSEIREEIFIDSIFQRILSQKNVSKYEKIFFEKKPFLCVGIKI